MRGCVWSALGVIGLSLGLALAPSSAAAELEVTAACYFPDTRYPQLMDLWQEGWSLTDSDGQTVIHAHPGMPLGGYAFVYFRNPTDDPVTVSDLMVEGIRLSRALARSEDSVGGLHGFSILLSELPQGSLRKLTNAGHPVWWRPEPQVVEPGAMGEVAVRLRRQPQVGRIDIGLVTDAGVTECKVPVNGVQPRFASISFSPELDRIYLYPSRSDVPGMKPERVLVDSKDVTSFSDAVCDSDLAVSPIAIKLPKPLELMSYHCFRVVYEDGATAVAGIRAWGHNIVYGMWGASLEGGSPEEVGRRYLTDWARHNINVHMGMFSGPSKRFLETEEGWDFCSSLGIRLMATWIGNARNPIFYFLMDEPDAHDFAIDDLEPLDCLGCLGQALVEKSQTLRRRDPKTPMLLNIDNTYKPENWYMYHQLADIACVDPYYPEQLDFAYARHPAHLAAHTKPGYVYAVSTISQSSCAPKPLHVILCSTKYYSKATGYTGRFPTPEEKRMEVYYALAAGAKGLSYWWFSPDSQCRGCGDNDPEAKRLWKEIGLLGAEVRTAGPVIAASCPAELKIDASRYLWVRALVSGTDTLAVVIVNDDVLCDRLGTVVKPVENARVEVDLPSWLEPVDVFDVAYEGCRDVGWKRNGSVLTLDLGEVEVGRFVVVTSDWALRRRLQSLYKSRFAGNVAHVLSGDNARLPDGNH